MTYRTATVAQLKRHAPGTPPAVLDRIETGDETDAAALCSQALEGLARRLAPGTVRTHPRYGCRFEVTPGGLVVRQGACPWGKRGFWCKHQAAEIGRALDARLEARLAALSYELGPGPIQPTSCGSCGDPVDGDECHGCGRAANTITVRASMPLDPPGGLNR